MVQASPGVAQTPITIINLQEGAAPIRRVFSDDTGVRNNDDYYIYSHLAECLKRPTLASAHCRLVQPSLIDFLGGFVRS